LGKNGQLQRDTDKIEKTLSRWNRRVSLASIISNLEEFRFQLV
jgi:hypothetical protein